MERIQSAIEKARKAREQSGKEPSEEQPMAAPEETVSPRQPVEDAPTEQAVPTADMSDEQRKALWKSVAAFQPQMQTLHKNRILAAQSVPEAAPYDVLRTKILHQMRKNNWRRIAVTSSGAGSGKTVTTLNTAFSLARQTELRIMVIELDFRRPSMTRMLGLADPVQFSEALADRDAPETHMRRYGNNLIIGANQSTARNPSELLQGVTAARVLDRLESVFAPDVMLFDTPPLMVSDDTLAFLDQVDCALLVAEAERSRPEDIDRAEQELAARTNVLGVVLNKCRYMDGGDSYGAYGY